MLTGLGLTDSLGEGASQAQQAAGRAGTAAAAGALEGFEDEPGPLGRVLRPGQGHGVEADGDDVEELVGPPP